MKLPATDRAPDLLAELKAVVASYKHNNPMRTADMHNPSCRCLRCAIDRAEAALSLAGEKQP
jgi:hypothetical protein